MRRFPRDVGGKLTLRRQRDAVFGDEPAQRASVTETVERAGQQRAMDIGRRFVPGAKRAAGDVHLDAFRRSAEPRILPIVNRPRAVGRQVGNPTAGQHSFENAGGPVAEQVRAVDQHHRSIALTGRLNGTGTSANRGGTCLRAGLRRCLRVDENFIGPRQIATLGKRKHLQAAQIERSDVHFSSLTNSRRASNSPGRGDRAVPASYPANSRNRSTRRSMMSRLRFQKSGRVRSQPSVLLTAASVIEEPVANRNWP